MLTEMQLEAAILKITGRIDEVNLLYIRKIAEQLQIAGELNESDEAVKTRLVIEYGTIARDEDGMVIGFKLPATVNVSKIYPYTRRFDQRTENGKLFNCYLVMKATHDMDTKEMANLLDGVVYEAKELNIETESDYDRERMLEEWAKSIR